MCAKAGIEWKWHNAWIPASAGMTIRSKLRGIRPQVIQHVIEIILSLHQFVIISIHLSISAHEVRRYSASSVY